MADRQAASSIEQPQTVPSPTSRSGKNRSALEDSGRPGKRPRLHSPVPVPMTAAVAHAEEKQQQHKSPAPTSANPQAEVFGALMGVNSNATSPAIQNAKLNAVTSTNQPATTAAENLQQSSDARADNSTAQTSPTSITSLGSIGSVVGASGSGTAVASPQPMDGTTKTNATNIEPVSPDSSKMTSMSYPAPFLTPQSDGPRRGVSLPHSGLRQNTRSPSSNKKHKCPYCSTEFTRHHNLKSHLLTHSQEKPYVCATCQSRFRRLHDLKRHTKLHTGERPHVCPKCNRKFARGDALARHNKGPGGCAGRRASLGSYDNDDGDGDETMEGVVYGEPENMEDEEGNMRGAPQIRRQPPSGDDSMDNSSTYRLPSTYPPIQGRPQGTSFPPPGYSSSNPSHAANVQYSGAAGGLRHGAPSNEVFVHNPMTESPKPISPAQRQNTGTMDSSIGRGRSPSNPQYAQPYHPRGSSGSSSLTVPPHGPGPQLPPPHSLNPPDPRFTLPSQVGPTHPPTQPSGPPTHMSGSGPLSSHSNSSSHGFSGHGSGEGHHKGTFPTNEERLWAVVRTLEQQMTSMRETIDSLRAEVANLKQAAEQRT